MKMFIICICILCAVNLCGCRCLLESSSSQESTYWAKKESTYWAPALLGSSSCKHQITCNANYSQFSESSVRSLCSKPAVFNMGGHDPRRVVNHLWRRSRVDILCTQVYYICFIRILDEGGWVIVGCYNGSRYEKG